MAHAAAVCGSGSGFCIIGHRGNCQLAPENTLPSFELALESTPAFELDVQLTSDDVPIVFHNETLNKTSDGTGRVDETTWEEVCKLDAGAWFGQIGQGFGGVRVPSLAQVLEVFKGRAHIHLELKSSQPKLPEAVAHELQRSGWLSDLQPYIESWAQLPHASPAASPPELLGHAPGLTVTSFHLDQLTRSMQLLPGVPHGWLIQEITTPIIETAKAAGLQQLCPRVDACTRELVEQAQTAGILSLRGWGVRSKDLLRHAVDCRLHGATVNWPHEASAVLASMGASEAAGQAR